VFCGLVLLAPRKKRRKIFWDRVTRLGDCQGDQIGIEKISHKMYPNPFLSKIIPSLLPWKKKPPNLGYLGYNHPDRRKFAQSGHPGDCLL
jgi:hypothetical protein